MHDRPDSRPTAVDLFCGVGGLSLGLIQAGFRLLGGFDWDQTVLGTYAANFPDIPAVRCDLLSRSGEDLQGDLCLNGARIDLLVGGPPCQGFSVGGKKANSDPRNEGVLAFARLVTELRPRYFVMENVRGFLSGAHAGRRKRFCKVLEKGGYRVRLPIQALNAYNYGIPQRRVRAFVLGHLKDELSPDYPAPATSQRPTVRAAIADLALMDRHLRDLDADEYEGPLGPVSEFAAPLRRGRAGEVVTRITGCLRTRHSREVVARFRATRPGQQEAVSRFYRLAWGGISPTLRAGTGPDHGSHTAPRPIHPARARCITVREAARLHSFPDWFVFHGTKWHGFRQIGNSVPPLLAAAVLSKIMEVCGTVQKSLEVGRGT
jgi:DNA (cytosine-5)-methyltransferase 1